MELIPVASWHNRYRLFWGKPGLRAVGVRWWLTANMNDRSSLVVRDVCDGTRSWVLVKSVDLTVGLGYRTSFHGICLKIGYYVESYQLKSISRKNLLNTWHNHSISEYEQEMIYVSQNHSFCSQQPPSGAESYIVHSTTCVAHQLQNCNCCI